MSQNLFILISIGVKGIEPLSVDYDNNVRRRHHSDLLHVTHFFLCAQDCDRTLDQSVDIAVGLL